MANMIPGATSILGWGFNIFGSYSAQSKMRQLLDLTKNGTKVQNVNGVDYEVPATVTAGSSHDFRGSATFFSTKEEITKYFSAKAGISGGYAGFKGSLDVGYTKDQLNTSDYNYCIFDGQKLAYPLNINNANEHLLADSVLRDTDYTEMLSAAKRGFDKNNPAPFYRFFLKYGTHFVYEAEMGGSLYYYSAVSKSFSSSSHDVTVKASFEYNGLFSVKANADADWKNAGKSWVDNRSMQLVVVGGDVNFPTTANASFGTNMNEQYNKWINAVDSNPSPMGFKLQSVDKLFSGKVANSISQALQFFIASEIFIQLERGSATVAINGFPIDTSDYKSVVPERGNTHLFTYLALVIDRETGMVVNSASVLGEFMFKYRQNGHKSPLSSELPPELAKYEGNSRYMLIFMWYAEDDLYHTGTGPKSNINLQVAPSPPLKTFLISSGAGPIVENWKGHVTPAYEYTKAVYNVYIMIGVFGAQGQGIETMATTSLTDSPASAKMTVAFVPELAGDKVLFTPYTLN